MKNLYSEEIMDHFTNPRNMGVINDADAEATIGNPHCGDVMKMYIKVAKRPLSQKLKVKSKKLDKQTENEEYIKDIKFQTLGCGAAIASSSIATELVKGKSLTEALKLTSDEIARRMGKLPPVKYHCSILAEEGIKKVIENYENRRDKNQ